MSEKLMYGCSLKGFRATLADTLVEIGRENDNLIVVDAETGTATNAIGFRDAFPDRYVTCGIAEQAAVSFAFALSRCGKVPVVPLFSCFLARRACDQVYIQVGYAQANVKLVGCYSGMTTPNTGATHQSINDIAIMRSIPGMRVIETADPFEFAQALREVVSCRGPVYLRSVRGDLPEYEGRFVPQGHKFCLDKSTVLREGRDISLMASGIMVPRAMEAAGALEARGVSAEVINMTAIKPLDERTVLESARKTGRVVCAENSSVVGGVGSAIAECLGQYCPTPLRFVGVKDSYGWSGELRDLLEMYGLTTKEILREAESLLAEVPGRE